MKCKHINTEINFVILNVVCRDSKLLFIVLPFKIYCDRIRYSEPHLTYSTSHNYDVFHFYYLYWVELIADIHNLYLVERSFAKEALIWEYKPTGSRYSFSSPLHFAFLDNDAYFIASRENKFRYSFNKWGWIWLNLQSTQLNANNLAICVAYQPILSLMWTKGASRCHIKWQKLRHKHIYIVSSVLNTAE